MLALLVAVALGQCTKDVECKGERVCVDGRCVSEALVPKRAPDPRVEMLEAERPKLYWPISSLAIGLIAIGAGGTFSVLAGDGGQAAFAGLLTGLGFLIAGGISLGTTLWARGRVGAMIDELER